MSDRQLADSANTKGNYTIHSAALNLVRAPNETEQNYWRSWLGYLLDGWPKPPIRNCDP